MFGGPSGFRRRAATACLAAGLLAVAGCGADDEVVAEGADVDRPPTPSMALVQFDDVAAEVGLDFVHGAFRWEPALDPVAMMGGGVCWIDYDRDGWLDLYAVNTWSEGEWGDWYTEGALPSSRLYRNDGGRFTDVTAEAGAGVETKGNGCVVADLDRDGWPDLYVTTQRANVMLWNDGGGGFVVDEETAAASGWHAGASVGDVDGNGWPDLFVAGYADLNRPDPTASKGFPNTFQAEPDLLFLNDGPGEGARVRMREVAADVGIEPAGADYGLGSLLSDFDRDGDLDLYVANDTTPNQLYENVPAESGAGFRFVEQGVAAGVGDTGAGMGVATGDANGDGLGELVTTNEFDEHHEVLLNASIDVLRFEDALAAVGSPELGIGATGWGATWLDADLDGDLDLFVGTGAIPVRDVVSDREPAQLIENRGEDGLVDVSADVGLRSVGPRLARGVAAADYDNDGDIDLAVGSIGGQISLLRNSGAGGTWLAVALDDPEPGSIVTVTRGDGSVMSREITAGSSYLSSEDPRAHFGLGGDMSVVSVGVEWPDGARLDVDDVEPGRVIMVERVSAAPPAG